jgi:hypothetical protein
MNPDDKVVLQSVHKGETKTDITQAEVSFKSLTAEVLRDIARNEANSWEWRKAAVRFLINQNHKYAGMEYLRELVSEINSESEAEQEVRDIVESAVEEPLKTEQDKKIAELEAEIQRLNDLVPKFESSFKDIPPEDVHKLLEE